MIKREIGCVTFIKMFLIILIILNIKYYCVIFKNIKYTCGQIEARILSLPDNALSR